MSVPPAQPSRRTVLSSGSTLLAGFGLGMVLPATSHAATGDIPATARSRSELAAYRPVSVSSTDYAPTPGRFVVDRLDSTGVRGSGWRAGDGDPQWISVDLQAACEVESLRLTFEATVDDPPYVDAPGGNPRDRTTGQEILSSCAVAFVIEVSRDNTSWTQVYGTDSGRGGVVEIALPKPVTARWVRMTVRKRSNANPLGLNGFQVYGVSRGARPEATGWTDWGTRRREVEPLKVAGDGTVPLESGWDLTMDDWAGGDGAALSGTDVDTSRWLPATVPGTVLTSLVDQGHLPDPVAGLNNLQVPEALSRHAWWYRRRFRLPRGFDAGRGRRLWLEFDGINHEAEIWLDGTKVETQSFPFARGAYDVTGSLAGSDKDGHALAVRISPMPFPGSPTDKGPEGLAWVDAGATTMNRNSPTYLASSGWDWMPAVRDRAAGIWNHVRLRSTGDAVIGDPRVDTVLPDLPDTRTAELTVVVPVHNAATGSRRVTVSAAFGRVKVSQSVTVPGGGSADVTFSPATHPQLRLRDPELWWPNGYGEANLHELTLVASADGRESDRRATRFGIRQFGYEYDIPLTFQSATDSYAETVDFAPRTARYLRVLCRTRATDWGSSIWNLAVVDSSRADTDLALGREASASTVDDPGNAAGNVTDGNPRTRWSSSFEDDQWVRIDLGSSVRFDRAVITWERAYAKTYAIEVSDDGDEWTEVKSVDNSAVPLPFTGGSASLQSTEFAAQKARHLRVLCTARATSWGCSMWSLSVVDSNRPGTDLALRKDATASSSESGSGPENAVDGNGATRWSSAYQDGEWIQVDLGESVSFDRVAIVWESAYARSYTIQVSDDGESWRDVTSVDNTTVPLKISVNGVRVFCRGGNWGWDELLRRMPAERIDAAVRMHRDMNFTMIRNWVGSSNREEFYASCDEHGILVWNDFPNAWAMDPPDHDAFNGLARDTVRRYRIHPSIAVWCGANEGNPPEAIDTGMRDAVTAEAPGLLYQNNSAGGIVSGGGPYGWVEPARYFSPSTFGGGIYGFHTEIGMPTVSTAETMRNLVGDEPEWPIGGAWFYHDWSTQGNQAPQNYKAAIEERLGTAKDLEDFCRKAQFLNYENTRAMFEAWNARLWDDAGGLLLWMSHPAWYSTVWQTYDYDFDVNGTYYGARTSCETLHVQADPTDWRVMAVNHTPRDIPGAVVTARCYGLDGRRLGGEKRERVDLKGSATTRVFTAAPAEDLPAFHLLRLSLTDARGRVLSENTYWRYREPKDMRALNTVRTAKVSVDPGRVSRSGERRELTARVHNRGSSVAAMVRLSLRDERSGERVLPTLYGDNYLWLLPDETRTITVSWPAEALPSGRPRLCLDGYNVPAVSMGV
ncbi:discoidin domain-containing protein [Streptomyces sp. NPDC056909]|uniref:discoidin domain-containing protein n=1 Tax=Streptomyces sp. NPDC056909 TaxID=3345963 RepID=UPI0036933B1E